MNNDRQFALFFFPASELREWNFTFSNIFSNMPSCTVGPGEALSKCSQHESRLPLSTDPLRESDFFVCLFVCKNLCHFHCRCGKQLLLFHVKFFDVTKKQNKCKK
ncbi:hypothetical protein ACRRTK_001150 [Alexandromys fortis]